MAIRFLEEKSIYPIMACLDHRSFRQEDFFVVEGSCLVKLVGKDQDEPLNVDHLFIEYLRDKRAVLTFAEKEGKAFLKGFRYHHFAIKIPINEVIDFDLNNRLAIYYYDEDRNREYPGRLFFRWRWKFKALKSRGNIVEVDGKELYVRRGPKGRMYFNVEEKNLVPRVAGYKNRLRREGDNWSLDIKCLVKLAEGHDTHLLDTDKVDVVYGEEDITAESKFKYRYGIPFFKGYRLNSLNIKLPKDLVDVEEGETRLALLHEDVNRGSIAFHVRDKDRGSGRRSNSIFLDDGRMVYLRQSRRNRMYFSTSKKTNLPILINITKRIWEEDGNLCLKGWAFTKLLNSNLNKMDTNKVSLFFAEEEPGEISFKKRFGIPFLKGFTINNYMFKLPVDRILTQDIQNKLMTSYDGSENYGRIVYSVWDFTRGKNRNSHIFKKDGMAYYFRQTVKNTMYLTVREENYFDDPKTDVLVKRAAKEAKHMDDDFILMYEKECAKYEESASVLYEKLIDMGYKNVYYILEKDHPAREKMDEKYKANLIDKHSFEHIKMFFACKKFVGTETIGHAIQLRAANKTIVDKVNSKDLSYVFLQHGVMYMVSLNADLRSGFKQNGLKLYRVVTSSQNEANHFLDLADFRENEVYVTGLAKFDKSVRYDWADKVVIMPTWRRWESNQAREDFSKTGYYKMIEKIVNKVPAELKDKIIILPHPLMQQAMENSTTELSNYMPGGKTHDEVLKECRLLITDYSSIAYDAFYRGSNVVFYWEEKEECMENYGGGAFLMLNDGNVFGDVCYDDSNLEEVIKKNYYGNQLYKHYYNYKQIVSFDDNRNAERIMERMIEDEMIEDYRESKEELLAV